MPGNSPGVNPNVPQGLLNRVRGSVTIPLFTAYNITAPYLGREMLQLAFTGDSVEYIENATGATKSPQPYLMSELRCHLLTSQAFADSYKRKMETNSDLGDITVRPDSSKLSPYILRNCSIGGVEQLTFNGRDNGYRLRIRGFYPINSDLYNGAGS